MSAEDDPDTPPQTHIDEKRCWFKKSKNKWCRSPIPPKTWAALAKPVVTPVFCVHHSAKGGASLQGERVPCPIDPSHMVYKSRLSKHTRICQAKKMQHRQEALPYFSRNINLRRNVPQADVETVRLADAPREAFAVWVAKIRSFGEAYSERIAQYADIECLTDPDVPDPASAGRREQKHLTQISSVIAHMRSAGLVSPATTFLEFGSGKGKLSHYLAAALDGAHSEGPGKYVLVEREARRYKMERKWRECSLRLSIDLRDLQLSLVPELREATWAGAARPLVVAAKHLCGGGTDVSLRCAVETAGGDQRVHGVAILQCCYGKVSLDSFVGDALLREWDLDDPQSFEWVRCAAEAATSTKGLVVHGEDVCALGHICRGLVEQGRCRYLADAGFGDVHCVRVVEEAVSPQNVLLLAVRQTLQLSPSLSPP